MKFRWRVVWSDGRVDTCVYAVERSLAERGAQKCIRQRELYSLGAPAVAVARVEFIPE